MLNLNSPTVQAMMAQSPNGFGNMPVYYGNTPQVETISTQVQQPQSQQTHFQTPYPSPKEMLTQQGQQTIYQPTSFAPYPPNVVGIAHPGYNPTYYQQSNPYYYSNGYGNYQPTQQQCMPSDEDARITWETANNNGVTYREQIETESKLYKLMSRIVSKNIGRSEEEAKKCEDRFNIYDRNEQYRQSQEQAYQIRKQNKIVIKVKVKVGDTVIAARSSEDHPDFQNDRFESNVVRIEQAEKAEEIREANKDYAFRMMHNQAIERKYDNTDLLEFFNGGGSSEITLAIQAQELKNYNNSLIAKTYDKDTFRARLLRNNGIKSREEQKAVDRFVGRYGYLPNGTPISPQHDPAMSECFSYNPKTGCYDVTLPNYMSKAFEGARSRFLRSLDDT